MIKHLPEGLTPFEDLGFARYPYFVMENMPFALGCRVDDSDAVPVLRLWVNGAEQPMIEAEVYEPPIYRFSVPGYPFGTNLSYAIVTDEEEGRVWHAPICREIIVEQPEEIYCKNKTAYLCFAEGLSLAVEAGETLNLRLTTERAVDMGNVCTDMSLQLNKEFSLRISKDLSFCEVKRLSDTVLSLRSLMMLVDGDGRVHRMSQCWNWSAGHVWGTGERFDAVDQLGLGSSGRVIEKFTHQGEQSYIPMPFFMTDMGYGLYQHSAIPVSMRFTEELILTQELDEREVMISELLFGTPGEILSQYITLTGKPKLPPEWSFGLWISANGWSSDAEVEAQLSALQKYDYPADVMVLEAWSDERTFYRWNGDGSWNDPAALIKRIREAGLHLLLWQIPIIKYEWEGSWGEQLRSDEREAIEKQYCVMNEDGTPYRITEKWFHNSLLLDFTNPAAVQWWFDKRNYLLDMGVEGFKTDGGEFLFDRTTRLHDGTSGLAAHNRYPSQYIGAYHDFLEAKDVKGLTFSRAGFVGAQTQPMHWAGDQLSLWSELQSQLNAGISSGLSGIIFWGFDIGGFAGELPTAELYLRATAMACFCPVMQWHAEPRTGQFYASHEKGFNNDRSPWNLAEKLQDPSLLGLAVHFAKLRRELKPYLWEEAKYCVDNLRPMMAHLCLDFPHDVLACQANDEYMLGRSLLIAPVIHEGAHEREIYLPEGVWEDYFTGQFFEGGKNYRVHCALDRIPVYRRHR